MDLPFVVTIALITTRNINTVGFSLLGVVAMVVAGNMTEVEAFGFVDWNVLVILISVWFLAGYFGNTGIPEDLGDCSLRWSRGNNPLFVTLVDRQGFTAHAWASVAFAGMAIEFFRREFPLPSCPGQPETSHRR